jgi:hypothetical protein
VTRYLVLLIEAVYLEVMPIIFQANIIVRENIYFSMYLLSDPPRAHTSAMLILKGFSFIPSLAINIVLKKNIFF